MYVVLSAPADGSVYGFVVVIVGFVLRGNRCGQFSLILPLAGEFVMQHAGTLLAALFRSCAHVPEAREE